MGSSHRRLLLVFAHPDDESFGMGGTIARYVAQGVDVYYLCATGGEVGTIPPAMQGLYPTVKDLRLAELDCAAQTLGFKEVFLAGYKDSGMMGSPTTADPDCLWYRWQQEPASVTRYVVDIMRRVQPQVVVTFNKYGGYGHPDHIAIQQACEQAFHLAGEAAYAAGDRPPFAPQKLYYTALPARVLRFLLWTLRLRGIDPRRMGTNKDIDFQAVVEHIEPVHTRINIQDYLAAWDAASQCHASQGGGGFLNRLPGWLRRQLIRSQGYTRVQPAPGHTRIDEDDLFAGVVAQPLRQEATA
ncbi:MAG: PIG-L family deacetylase [Anaerolineae bacterium]|jgi:LmbE family N-acetylglucosaminyl deacetylase|nr:PIG-L family deacetylase [Anaerolineae bacterium]